MCSFTCGLCVRVERNAAAKVPRGEREKVNILEKGREKSARDVANANACEMYVCMSGFIDLTY